MGEIKLSLDGLAADVEPVEGLPSLDLLEHADPLVCDSLQVGVVARDESYLEAVTNKRVRMFEEIQSRQALHRLNIGGEAIK